MGTGSAGLTAAIDAHPRTWEPTPPFVELAIYERVDAAAIARTIDAFSREHLDSPVAHALFHQSSIGSVTGVTLEDGRSVVIKAHQPDRSHEFPSEIVQVQSHLMEVLTRRR
jgi:hypothetical protein